MEHDYEKKIEKLVNITKDLDKDYYEYKERLKELEGVKNDIRHIYELSNLNAVEMVQIASVYRKKLRERREVKDNLHTLNTLKGVIDKHKDAFQELEYVLTKLNSRVTKEKQYFARSALGQELIDTYSKEGDDLTKTPNKDDLEKLKQVVEGKNLGG